MDKTKIRVVLALLFAVGFPCVRAAGAVPRIDNSTIINKVVCGYQGWFASPGDGGTRWTHWADDDSWIGPTYHHTDVWPDVKQYGPSDLFFVPNTTLTCGGAPYLFSDHRQGAVKTHFRWMLENRSDGALVQCFVVGCPHTYSDDGVLRNVMSAASKYGRGLRSNNRGLFGCLRQRTAHAADISH